MTENLKESIKKDIPRDGEWWKGGDAAFLAADEKMLKAGMSEYEILTILKSLYHAVADEYGD